MSERAKQIIYNVLIFVALLLICVGVNWSPHASYEYRYINKVENSKYGINEIIATNECSISDNNKINILGGDPQIHFDVVDQDTNYLEINLSKKAKKDLSVQIFIDYGNGYNENQSVITYVPKREKKAFVVIPKGIVYALRIDINEDYYFDSVDLGTYDYEEKVVVLKQNDIKKICIGIFMAVFLWGIVLFLNKKVGIYNVISKIIKKYKYTIIVALIAFLLESLCAWLKFYVACFWIGLILSLVIILIQRNKIKDNPEIVIAGLLLIIGLTMIYVKPFGHISWDIDSHYKWALRDSFFSRTMKYTEADFNVMVNKPVFLTIPGTREENIAKISEFRGMYNEYIGKMEWNFSLPHLPAGIGIAVLRLIGASFYWVYTLGCLPNLILYTILICAAISRVKSGKMIIAVIAMFPTNILLATNYSYDYWVVSFSILGMAYFVANCQENGTYITLKENIIMCAAFGIACIPKSVYCGMLLIPFFMPWKKIKKKRRYYIVCAVAFMALMAILLMATYTSVSGPGDTRGGDVNPSAQIAFILSDVGAYVSLMINFLKGYLSIDNMFNYVTHLAYLGIAGGTLIFQLLLFMVVLTDKNEYDTKAYSLWNRFVVIMFYLGTATLVATALYIVYTPVGSEVVLGCQPRYLLPIIYPLLSVIAGKGIGCKIKAQCYNAFVIIVASGTMLKLIYDSMLIYMR